MSTLHISIPEAMKAFIEAQVAQGDYSTASEYLRDLIRQAQERQARQDLEAKLLEGLTSGPAIEVTDAYWEKKRGRLSDHHQKKEHR